MDQPAGDLLVPLLLQVSQHTSLHEHLINDKTCESVGWIHVLLLEEAVLTLLAPTTMLLLSRSKSASSSSTA